MAVAAILLGTGWGSNQITPMLLVYSDRLGLTTGTLQAMFGVYALGLIPGLLLAGPLSDTRGRRGVVLPAAALSLLATVTLIAGGHHTWLLFVARLLNGVSNGAVFGVGTAWLREVSLPPFGAAGAHTIARRAAVAMTAGFAFGPLLAGLLAQWAPDPLLVPYVPHLVLMTAALVAVRTVPETVPSGRSRGGARLRLEDVRSPRFWRIVAPMAPWGFAATAVAVALLPSLTGAADAAQGIALTASIAALCALAGVLIQPLARRLDAGGAGNRAALAGLATTAAGMLLAAVTAASEQIWLLVPCALVFGAAYGLILVAGLVEVQRLAEPRALASLTAVYYALTYAGFALPVVLAALAGGLGYPLLLTICAVLVLATAAWVTPRGAMRPSDRPTSPAEQPVR
ncbi:MAG: MFS transporter [Actinobacteria bacterium]|nr:MFS transporter [Actinomycetota bacterium]